MGNNWNLLPSQGWRVGHNVVNLLYKLISYKHLLTTQSRDSTSRFLLKRTQNILTDLSSHVKGN